MTLAKVLRLSMPGLKMLGINMASRLRDPQNGIGIVGLETLRPKVGGWHRMDSNGLVP